MTPISSPLLGLKVARFPCNMEFVRWRRRHRNNRIDRKWRKRYGAVMRCRRKTLRVGNTIYVCQCVLDKIAQTVPAK